MSALTDIDLTKDPLAARYVKSETVCVAFARHDGVLQSPEGENAYRQGDAIVTGFDGTQWSVSRDRFHARYELISPAGPDADGTYRSRPIAVLAKQIFSPFTAARSSGGDVLEGRAGDWLLQYGAGDFGVARNERFVRIYRRL